MHSICWFQRIVQRKRPSARTSPQLTVGRTETQLKPTPSRKINPNFISAHWNIAIELCIRSLASLLMGLLRTYTISVSHRSVSRLGPSMLRLQMPDCSTSLPADVTGSTRCINTVCDDEWGCDHTCKLSKQFWECHLCCILLCLVSLGACGLWPRF